MGGQVSFVASMGDDDFAHHATAEFKQDGINTDHVHLSEGENTGIALILVDSHGGNCISIAPNANNNLTTAMVADNAPVITGADYLLLQLETPMDGVERAADLARKNGTQVVLNPAPAKPLPDSLLSQLDMITPNETEAEFLTGITVTDEQSAEQAALHFTHKGVKTVVITLGSRGAYLYEDGQGQLIPGYKVDAMDTTAAGDTFNGALLVGLSKGKTMAEAIQFAHKASALSVTKMGAQTSIPYLSEVESFFA